LEFLSEGVYGLCEIVALHSGSAQFLDRIPPFRDRARSLLDRAIQFLLCLDRALWEQLGNRLEPEQQTVEALQERVVQIASDACSLADTSLERHGELMMQLPDAQLIDCPQQR
jgi:hypothetical protein